MKRTLILGDCLEKMQDLEDNSIDLVLADPPYGTTNAKWDSVIDFGQMWAQLNRISKQNAAILLFGTEPFSSTLRLSNLKAFKYDWVWDKITAVGHLVAKKAPMRQHEIISVFYRQMPTYNPQMVRREKPTRGTEGKRSELSHGKSRGYSKVYTHKYPKSILRFPVERGRHPTQKPLTLTAYLIATYSNPGDTVLDFVMGSGTTGVATDGMERNFIGIEKDKEIFIGACERMGVWSD